MSFGSSSTILLGLAWAWHGLGMGCAFRLSWYWGTSAHERLRSGRLPCPLSKLINCFTQLQAVSLFVEVELKWTSWSSTVNKYIVSEYLTSDTSSEISKMSRMKITSDTFPRIPTRSLQFFWFSNHVSNRFSHWAKMKAMKINLYHNIFTSYWFRTILMVAMQEFNQAPWKLLKSSISTRQTTKIKLFYCVQFFNSSKRSPKIDKRTSESKKILSSTWH